MPAQLQRIFLVFLGFTLLFLVAKKFLTPESYGQYGHYRGNALEENKREEPKYVDQATCADCHQDIVDLKGEGLHMDVGCQICHGPAYLHIDTTTHTKLDRPDSRDFCATCHQIHLARREDAINQVDIEEHNTDEDKCINCHNPHEPWLDLE